MQLTVVIPTYNEAQNLPGIVSALLALPIGELKILIVDDNSPDGTGQIADELAREYGECISVLHRTGKAGLGSAYLRGFGRALDDGAQAIAQIDADFSHPPDSLLIMLEALKTYDVVVGSRYVERGAVDEQWPIWRKGLSAFGNLYARTILNLPVQDVTSGFKVWRRETLSGMPLERVHSNGYAFQIEMSYLAYKLGYTIFEVPIYFADRVEGRSKMSFHIQREAAIRVWQMLYNYRNLNVK